MPDEVDQSLADLKEDDGKKLVRKKGTRWQRKLFGKGCCARVHVVRTRSRIDRRLWYIYVQKGRKTHRLPTGRLCNHIAAEQSDLNTEWHTCRSYFPSGSLLTLIDEVVHYSSSDSSSATYLLRVSKLRRSGRSKHFHLHPHGTSSPLSSP